MTDDEITRRDVLRGLGGLALTSVIGCREPEPGEPADDVDRSLAGACEAATIAAVANRPLAVSGVQAYAQKTVSAGETIDFRVSSSESYDLSIVRIGWDTDSPARDWTLQTFSGLPASPRSIRPGSYIHVETALRPSTAFDRLTLECWVRPFRSTAGGPWQGLISQHTHPDQCGFALLLSDTNVPHLYFGTGGAYNSTGLIAAPSPLAALQWHHVVAVLDAPAARLYVDGVEVVSAGSFHPARPGPAPLRLGAYGDATGTSYFLDGDLAMPVIYSRALGATEIATRAARTQPPQVPVDPAVIACWPLAEEHGPVVADASGCGRTGTIVNRGTWMIGGPSFDAALVERKPPIGQPPYNPDQDPMRGHGLRLSSSDLYDCAWPISKSYSLPSDCPPGVYVGRIRTSTTPRYDVTFVVRRATIRPPAPVLVLCATNTWHAYNKSLDLFSFYDNHASGQPTYYQGIEMPWAVSTDPFQKYQPEYSYSHLVRAERCLHVWLELNGYDYDVISDRDLHANASILSSYQTVFIAGHSEYWSREGWTAIRSYLAAGGNVIVASGNTMFWRVSYDGAVIECRKFPVGDPDIGGRPNAKVGELYHEHDHQRGGLMREAGYPAWQAIGLECAGFNGPHASYAVRDRDHALFQTPELIALENGDLLGGADRDPPAVHSGDPPEPGDPGYPAYLAFLAAAPRNYAVGHEWDVSWSALSGDKPPLPAGYPTPSVLADAHGVLSFDYDCNWLYPVPAVISEIVEWVWSSGGRVLAAGSIGSTKALHDDPNLGALFRNTLHHNGVVVRLDVLAIGQDGHFQLKSYDGSSWSASWEDLGAGFTSNPPTGVQWAPNSRSAMAITPAGAFKYKVNTGAGWSEWDFGSTFQGRPAAVGWGRNRLDLFGRGADNHLWWTAWNGTAWSAWIDLGGSVASDPAAICWEGRRLSVAVRGAAGNVLYRAFVDGAWTPGWTDLGIGRPGIANFGFAPTMVVFAGNRLAVFAVDTGGRVFGKHWNGSSWYPSLTSWVDLGGIVTGRVHVAAWGVNSYTIFAVGPDRRLKAKWWDGATWGPSQTAWTDLGGDLVGEPTVASYRGSHISVLGVWTDGRVHHLEWNGSTWLPWQDLGGPAMRPSPAVVRWIAT